MASWELELYVNDVEARVICGEVELSVHAEGLTGEPQDIVVNFSDVHAARIAAYRILEASEGLMQHRGSF